MRSTLKISDTSVCQCWSNMGYFLTVNAMPGNRMGFGCFASGVVFKYRTLVENFVGVIYGLVMPPIGDPLQSLVGAFLL